MHFDTAIGTKVPEIAKTLPESEAESQTTGNRRASSPSQNR